MNHEVSRRSVRINVASAVSYFLKSLLAIGKKFHRYFTLVIEISYFHIKFSFVTKKKRRVINIKS